MKRITKFVRPRGATASSRIMRRGLLASAALTLLAFSSGSALAQSFRPVVSIETDPNGAANVRVAEQVYTAFTPSRTLEDLTGERYNITSDGSTLIRDVRSRNAKYGIHISNASPVSIDRFSFVNWDGGGGTHGGAIKLDRSDASATYIQRVFADAQSTPDGSYDISNTDFIGIERGDAPVYVRGATGRNFGDGGVDAKSNVHLMNVTIDGVHRGLRAWSNAQITIANSIINVPRGHEHVWLYNSTSSVRYYNVLWCIGATNPSPQNSACSTSPTVVRGGNISSTQARRQVVALSSNPLPATSNFFRTQIDRIVVDYSGNGGQTWRRMASGGATGRPPLGDTRYRVPFSLANDTYYFRVRFYRNGARVGSTIVVNEEGRTVSL